MSCPLRYDKLNETAFVGPSLRFILTSRVPVEGKSTVCVYMMGYVLINKANCSSCECIICRCRRFDLLPPTVLTQYVDAITTVVAV